MSTFRVVVFDYDGTLFDSRPAIVHCMQRAFEASGRPKPAPELALDTITTGLTLQDTFLILDKALRRDRPALNELVKTYRALYLEESVPLLKPFAGIREAVQQLHAGGVKCVVVSNKGIVAIRRSLDANGLTPFLDLVLGDEPGIPKKPDPAIVTDHILPKFAQLRTQQLLMVGDTKTDIQFAKNSGMACCWVSYGYGEAEHCRALGPEYEISSIAELPSLVQGAGN